MSIMMEYSWIILGVILAGFVLVSLLLQILNKNPAE